MADKLNPTPDVDCRYGAPVGRPSRRSFTDKQGRTFQLELTEDAPPMHLVRCPLDQGGYDRGGAYWGIGPPLYYYANSTGDITGYVRGATRERAKAAVRAIHPHARFYR